MPTTTLRPDGTWSAVVSGITGAPSLYAATNDDSDSSYFSFGGSNDVILTLGDFTLPAGSMVASVTPRVRAKASVAATQLGVEIGAVLSWFSLSTSFATYTGGGSVALLTEAAIDDAKITARSAVPWGSGATIDVAELYADVLYVGQPTTSVSSPSGTITDNTRPTIAWAHTPGTDGSGQTRYRVKVFSAAQYGAAGFSPETSTAAWDSSELLGSATSTIPTVDLADDTTFRAYVKTAQTVNAQPHWAEWAYSAFSIDAAAAPGAPTLSVVADGTNARIRFTVTKGTGDMDLYDVERSIDGGVTWSWVRGHTRADPPGDVAIGYDYEAGNGETVYYRARAVNVAGSASQAGPWSSTVSTSWSSDLIWIKHLRDTTLNMSFDALTIADNPEHPITQGIYTPVGRTDHVVVSDVRRLTVGEIGFETTTAAQKEELLELLSPGDVLLVQTPTVIDFGNRYIAIGNVRQERTTQELARPERVWRLPYHEVARPADDGVEVVGLTWSDINSTYATWQALLDSGQTWGSLV